MPSSERDVAAASARAAIPCGASTGALPLELPGVAAVLELPIVLSSRDEVPALLVVVL